MACFHPIQAWRTDERKIVFTDGGGGRGLLLPCGKCIGCRLVRARSWAIRCMHEAQLHRDNCFVTLTYADEKKKIESLDFEDLRLWIKRVRRLRREKIRYFGVGEYGEENKRPHFHVLLFGINFEGPKIGENLRRSPELEKTWEYGYSSVGDVTYESAAYVARYVCKKITGSAASAHYSRVDWRTGECYSVVPEDVRMSLKPGIGYEWFRKNWREVFETRNGVVRPGGFVCPPPKYYERLLEYTDRALLTDKEYERWANSKRFVEDCSPERLLDREKCAEAKMRFLRRNKI